MPAPLAQLSLVALDSARAAAATASPASDVWRVAVGVVAAASLGVIGWKIWSRRGEPDDAGPSEEPAPEDAPIDGELAKSLRFSAIRKRRSAETAAAPEPAATGANGSHAVPAAPPAVPPLPAPVSAANAMNWELMTEEQREEFITALGQSIAARKEEVETEVLRRGSGPSHAYDADAHCPECGSAIDVEQLKIGRIVCPGCGRGIAVYVVPDGTGSMAAFLLNSRENTPRSNPAVSPN